MNAPVIIVISYISIFEDFLFFVLYSFSYYFSVFGERDLI